MKIPYEELTIAERMIVDSPYIQQWVKEWIIAKDRGVSTENFINENPNVPIQFRESCISLIRESKKQELGDLSGISVVDWLSFAGAGFWIISAAKSGGLKFGFGHIVIPAHLIDFGIMLAPISVSTLVPWTMPFGTAMSTPSAILTALIAFAWLFTPSKAIKDSLWTLWKWVVAVHIAGYIVGIVKNKKTGEEKAAVVKPNGDVETKEEGKPAEKVGEKTDKKPSTENESDKVESIFKGIAEFKQKMESDWTKFKEDHYVGEKGEFDWKKYLPWIFGGAGVITAMVLITRPKKPKKEEA